LGSVKTLPGTPPPHLSAANSALYDFGAAQVGLVVRNDAEQGKILKPTQNTLKVPLRGFIVLREH
jgi:hypothetical protein